MRWLVWAALVAGCAASAPSERPFREGDYDGPCDSAKDCFLVRTTCCTHHCVAVVGPRVQELSARTEEQCLLMTCPLAYRWADDGTCRRATACVGHRCRLAEKP